MRWLRSIVQSFNDATNMLMAKHHGVLLLHASAWPWSRWIHASGTTPFSLHTGAKKRFTRFSQTGLRRKPCLLNTTPIQSDNPHALIPYNWADFFIRFVVSWVSWTCQGSRIVSWYGAGIYFVPIRERLQSRYQWVFQRKRLRPELQSGETIGQAFLEL